MGTSSGPRLSGMQRQVLSLYRGFLRAARLKSAEDRQKIESFVSKEFRHNAKNVERKNFLYIEYLVRRGKKQLDQLKSPDTVGLSALNDGAVIGYGAKAQEIFGQVRGKDCRHEKTKKKRGSYRGAQIDLQSHSVNFNYSDEVMKIDGKYCIQKSLP